MDNTSQGWAAWKISVIYWSEKHSQTHERNARACAVNVMSFCMQPGAHICESECKNTQTSGTRCLDFSIMRSDDRWSLWGLQDISYGPMGALLTVVLLPGHKELCHFFIYCAGPHGGIYPQTDSGTGRRRDWISLFTKQGRNTPVFALNLCLTPRCPFVFLLCWMPFLIYLLSK